MEGGPVGVKAEEPGLCHLLSTNIKIVCIYSISFLLGPTSAGPPVSPSALLLHLHSHPFAYIFFPQSAEQLEKGMPVMDESHGGPSQPGTADITHLKA